MLKNIILIVLGLHFVSSVSIYRDTDLIKKTDYRNGRQLNAIPLYDDEYYGRSRYNMDSGSQWESAEWPRDLTRRDNSYESEERPYNWFYYNKYLTNGRFNHLYNGPAMDTRAGIGESGNAPPRVLPKPAPVYGRSFKPRF